MKLPYIASEWRTLFTPHKYGNYINDHTLYRDDDGKWNLIGITSREGIPCHERYFAHAISDSLSSPMTELDKVVDTGMLAWAPCVCRHDGLYYMYYGPSPTRMAVSPDSREWFGHEIRLRGNPPMACHRDHFVLALSENRWLMYAAGVHDRKGSICCLESHNLTDWRFAGFALTSGERAPLRPAWGAFESPFVVEYDGLFYLFTTYTDCSAENYHHTLVFAGKDPFQFGCFDGASGAQPVAELNAHAPEIVQDVDGTYRITSCGWKNLSFSRGSVVIAELGWK